MNQQSYAGFLRLLLRLAIFKKKPFGMFNVVPFASFFQPPPQYHLSHQPISFSVSALFSSGLILKKSFIQGQFLTPMKARIFHWIISRESLQGPSEKVSETASSLLPAQRPWLLHPSCTVTARHHPPHAHHWRL